VFDDDQPNAAFVGFRDRLFTRVTLIDKRNRDAFVCRFLSSRGQLLHWAAFVFICRCHSPSEPISQRIHGRMNLRAFGSLRRQKTGNGHSWGGRNM
jgi:hypothetical protein